MGFRDDREASVQRIDVLERELASAQNELEAALLRAAEVDDLRKRCVTLTSERDALRRATEPDRASRSQTSRLLVGVGVVLVLGTGFVAFQQLARQREHEAAAQALADGVLRGCELERDSFRGERDTAQGELAQIDSAHEVDLGELQRQLNTARLHEAGPALLVTARVVSRSGDVPAGATDDCTLAIRALSSGTCAASVTCGATEVFPLADPPDVFCQGWSEVRGQPVTLSHARAGVRSTPLALFEYDEQARTIDVRETAAGGFTMHLRVQTVLPYQLR